MTVILTKTNKQNSVDGMVYMINPVLLRTSAQLHRSPESSAVHDL